MDSLAVSSLPTLLGKAFPPNGLPAPEIETLLALERIIDADIAPAAAAYDAQGRYPSSSVAALKRCGVLRTAVPRPFGGPGFSSRFSLEVQGRLGVAGSAGGAAF